MQWNQTIKQVIEAIHKEPATAKQLSEALNIPLGNVIAILISRKQFFRNDDGTWEVVR